uniref:Uncharacterized protein n=2 Tax=Solanum tuberosum TaxID=4113 RepID=M1CQU0_SOLTU
MFLPRFSGNDNDNSKNWIFRAELYFTYLGFDEMDWLPLPSFYFDGEDLCWFDWLFRNKLFFDWNHFKDAFTQRFQQQTNIKVLGRLANSSQVHYDSVNSVQIISQSVVVSPFPVSSHFSKSSAIASTYNTGNSQADHVFDKLPVKYHTADAWDFTNGGITSLAALDNTLTAQNGRSKSTTALVEEPSVVSIDLVFAEISCKTASRNFHDPNASVHDEHQSARVVSKVSDTSICGNDNLPPEVTIQMLDKSPHNIKLGEIKSIAPRVSLLVPFDGPEVVRPNEHLVRDMSMRYVDVNSLASGSPKWKTDLESFDDCYLADFFMEPVDNEELYLNILTSLMHSVKILPNTENGKSIREFNGEQILSQFPFEPAAKFLIVTIPTTIADPCVWDPGIGFDFIVLTSYTVYNVKELLLLGCTDRLFLIVYSNSMNRVWDPGQQWCVNSYLRILFTCLSIAYTLALHRYNYDATHEVLAANFKHTLVLHLHYIILLGTMLLEWKEVVLRSGYKVKFQVEPPSTSYIMGSLR